MTRSAVDGYIWDIGGYQSDQFRRLVCKAYTFLYKSGFTKNLSSKRHLNVQQRAIAHIQALGHAHNSPESEFLIFEPQNEISSFRRFQREIAENWISVLWLEDKKFGFCNIVRVPEIFRLRGGS